MAKRRKIPDSVWAVICDTMKKYEGIECTNANRKYIEKNLDIKIFDGGVFISDGPEFDLYVVPERQGKWNIRGELTKYLNDMSKIYGTLEIGVNENNHKSLRLAKFFGFKEVANEDGEITLERAP